MTLRWQVALAAAMLVVLGACGGTDGNAKRPGGAGGVTTSSSSGARSGPSVFDTAAALGEDVEVEEEVVESAAKPPPVPPLEADAVEVGEVGSVEEPSSAEPLSDVCSSIALSIVVDVLGSDAGAGTEIEDGEGCVWTARDGRSRLWLAAGAVDAAPGPWKQSRLDAGFEGLEGQENAVMKVGDEGVIAAALRGGLEVEVAAEWATLPSLKERKKDVGAALGAAVARLGQ